MCTLLALRLAPRLLLNLRPLLLLLSPPKPCPSCCPCLLPIAYSSSSVAVVSSAAHRGEGTAVHAFSGLPIPGRPASGICLRFLWGEVQRTATRVLQQRRGISAQQWPAMGLTGAHNERPHGDSKVPPYSAQARIRVDAQCARGQSIAVLCCASTALVADGQGVSAAATERNVGARGHARQLGITLGRTYTARERRGKPPLITHCRPDATAVSTLFDNCPLTALPGESQTARGIHPSALTEGLQPHVCYNINIHGQSSGQICLRWVPTAHAAFRALYVVRLQA